MDIRERFHVLVRGSGQPMLFAHGYGCDQLMWRYVAPHFERDHRTVLYDLAGCGRSHPTAYDSRRHGSLQGYAEDVLEICEALDLQQVIFVGHSVAAMIGVLAANARPERFARLVLLGPSPCYINDGEYVGGFSRGDIDGLIDAADDNYLGWASSVAPLITDNPDRPELAAELKNSFCRMDPDIGRAFARVTFYSDNRADLPKCRVPSLVIQSAVDAIAPPAVGEYVHRHVPNSDFVVLDTRGHCAHLSAPTRTVEAIRAFLRPG